MRLALAARVSGVEPAHQPPSRVFLLVAGYLLWVSLFFAVQGFGRMQCQVPSRTWVEAGADARERHLRGFRYDKSEECLDRTVWYSTSMGVLGVLAVVAPFVIVGFGAKRILRFAHGLPFDVPETAAVIYGFAFLLALVLSMGPYGAAQEFYDRYGVGTDPPAAAE